MAGNAYFLELLSSHYNILPGQSQGPVSQADFSYSLPRPFFRFFDDLIDRANLAGRSISSHQ
ncbi:hypothetical protein ASD67_17070 [Sphingopyxis sp. Root1497]|nr:hypothetical protein ASD67_17070 [Sphingopyxis sp. Root1497]